MRRRLKSPSRPLTTNRTSILAAITCCRVTSPGCLRENVVRRGRMAAMRETLSRTTQSPIAGQSSESCRSRPPMDASRSPDSVQTRSLSRSADATRAGSASGLRNGANSFSKCGFQPKFSRDIFLILFSTLGHLTSAAGAAGLGQRGLGKDGQRQSRSVADRTHERKARRRSGPPFEMFQARVNLLLPRDAHVVETLVDVIETAVDRIKLDVLV